MNTNKGYCQICEKETNYVLKKVRNKRKINGKEYELKTNIAVCQECGEEMFVPGLLDSNLRAEDDQYRRAKNLITIREIQQLMEVYHIGKAPLSLALGFGEVTITRYLDGQMPSKAYSEIMRHALTNAEYMEKLVNRNKDRLADTAYRKVMKSIQEYKEKNGVSSELLACVSYIFKMNPEVGPFALHKLLYFAQGIYMAIYEDAMFPEDCIASKHGPLYVQLYELLKTYNYYPVDDPQFSLLKDRYKELGDGKRGIIDLVLLTFGMYSGRTLDVIIRNERPWIMARGDLEQDEDSENIVEKDLMYRYFRWVVQKFGVESVETMSHYVKYQMMEKSKIGIKK